MKTWFKQNEGYVLISTLFFLMLSGLFSHSVIQVSSNHLLQLRQLTTAYEMKTALNMSEAILQGEFEKGKVPLEGSIHTSAGEVKIKGKKQNEQVTYNFTLLRENGDTYRKEVIWAIPAAEE